MKLYGFYNKGLIFRILYVWAPGGGGGGIAQSVGRATPGEEVLG